MSAHALLRSCIVLFTAVFLRPAPGFGRSQLSQCHKTPGAPEDCVASAGGAVITSSNVPPWQYLRFELHRRKAVEALAHGRAGANPSTSVCVGRTSRTRT